MQRFINLLVIGLMAATSTAQGLKVDPHAEVAAVLFAASATQAALAKSLDVKLKAQQQRIDQLASELKGGDDRHRAELISAEEVFVADLAAKDREYAAQIAVFRNTVSDIASTPDGAQALERFNAGDEVGALAILDKLRAGNEKMRAEKARLEDAAEARRISRLALEARLRGKVPIDTVIARFEEVVKLDPGVAADWLELKRLYIESGNLPDARRAVDAMAAAARTESERAKALQERADVLMHQGDLVAARTTADDALRLCRKLLAENPADRGVGLMYSSALLQFGEVARMQGDLVAAETAYEEEVAYTRRYASAPSATDLDRYALSADLLHLADTLIQRGEMQKARGAIEESISIMRTLHVSTPDNIKYEREIAESLMWLSDVLVSLGQFTEAHQANEEILATASRLSAAEPDNAAARADVGLGHLKAAALLAIEGQFAESSHQYEQARSIFHDLDHAPGAAIELPLNEGAALIGLSDTSFLLQDVAASKRFGEESVSLYRKLAAAEASDVNSREFLAEALYSLATALIASKEFSEARKAIDEGLQLDQALIKRGFNSSDVQFDISSGELLMGNLLDSRDRPREALSPLRKSLDLRRQLATAQPSSSTLSRGVAETMHSLALTQGSTLSWGELGQYLDSMKKKGVFWPRDQQWLDEARQHQGGT